MGTKELVMPNGVGFGAWVAFTPSFNNYTPNSNIGYYRYRGDYLDIEVYTTCSATLPTGVVSLNLPAGYQLDPIIGVVSATHNIQASTRYVDVSTSGAVSIIGAFARRDATSVYLTVTPGDVVTATVPFTWAAGDVLEISASIPIA